jgi:tRNA(Leu) C34 or U34 (ribose-2'-O)-methylase TrmL
MRGYFGIGIYKPKTEANVGTLWRSAYQLGAAFIFVVGARYKRQHSDTVKAWKHILMFELDTWNDFLVATPKDCKHVFIENFGHDTINISGYKHPERAVYILGSEDNGIPSKYLKGDIITIPSIRTSSFNVAVAGSIVMYDRLTKGA